MLLFIESIYSPIPRGSFSQEKVERLAILMLEGGGVIIPPIVKEKEVERFEVIHGHLQYYAAVKAQEMNDSFEMIRAFVVDDKLEEIVKSQLAIINNYKPELLPENNIIKPELIAMEKRITSQIMTTQKLQLLEAFNQLNESSLFRALATTGMGNKTVKRIVDWAIKQRQAKPFSSLQELMERSKIKQGKKTVRLLTEAKLIEIMDSWEEIGFSW